MLLAFITWIKLLPVKLKMHIQFGANAIIAMHAHVYTVNEKAETIILLEVQILDASKSLNIHLISCTYFVACMS